MIKFTIFIFITYNLLQEWFCHWKFIRCGFYAWMILYKLCNLDSHLKGSSNKYKMWTSHHSADVICCLDRNKYSSQNYWLYTFRSSFQALNTICTCRPSNLPYDPGLILSSFLSFRPTLSCLFSTATDLGTEQQHLDFVIQNQHKGTTCGEKDSM